jgi:hypothetical protein
MNKEKLIPISKKTEMFGSEKNGHMRDVIYTFSFLNLKYRYTLQYHYAERYNFSGIFERYDEKGGYFKRAMPEYFGISKTDISVLIDKMDKQEEVEKMKSKLTNKGKELGDLYDQL